MELKHHEIVSEIELKPVENGYIPSINGKEQNFTLRNMNERIYKLEFAGGGRTAFCTRDGNHFYVNIDGKSFVFNTVEETLSNFEAGGNTGNKDIVKTPMPGNVVKVLVEKGQSVAEGDGLIIIEAMKMETTIFSTISGTVQEVNATEGEQVDSDKVLIIVEKETEE